MSKSAILIFLLAGPVWTPAACTGVPAGPILGRQLAAAMPELAGLPETAVFGFAPGPGARRTISAPEVARLARRHGIEVRTPVEVCFESEARPVDAGEALAALRAALGEPSWEITITDHSRFPVPKGTIEFRTGPRWQLRPDRADGTCLIRGAVVAGERLRYPLWVRARIEARQRRVVAAAALKAGEVIGATDIRVEEGAGFPSGEAIAEDPAAVIGKVPRRAFRAGERIRLAALAAPREVQRGDRVAVEVASGPAHLRLEAEAETSGRRGERIVLVNAQTRKRFTARVTGPGRAGVDAGSPAIKGRS